MISRRGFGGLAAMLPVATPLLGHGEAGQAGSISIDDYPQLYRDGERDDSAAMARALSDAMKQKKVLRIPAGGPILLKGGTKLPPLNQIALIGDGVADMGGAPYGRRGSAIWLRDEKNTAFELVGDWYIAGLNFFWPEQVERNAPPIAYPPLFANVPGEGAGSGYLERLRVTNAYDLFVVDGEKPGDVAGDIVMSGCRAYAVRDCFRLRNVPEVIQVSDCLFSYESFDFEVLQYGRAKPSFTLRDFTTSVGSFLHVVGDGTPDKICSTAAGMSTSNVFVYGYGKGVWADRGTVNARLGETSFDGVPTAVQVDPGGTLVACHHHGGIVYAYRPGYENAPLERAVYHIAEPSPGRFGNGTSCQLTVSDVEIGFANGSLFDISGRNVGEIKIALKGTRYGRYAPNSVGVRVRAPNAALEIDHSNFSANVPGHGAEGVRIEGPIYLASLVGNRFYGLERPVVLDGPGRYHLAGNASVGTTGPRSLSGSGADLARGGGNDWDRL